MRDILSQDAIFLFIGEAKLLPLIFYHVREHEYLVQPVKPLNLLYLVSWRLAVSWFKDRPPLRRVSLPGLPFRGMVPTRPLDYVVAVRDPLEFLNVIVNATPRSPRQILREQFTAPRILRVKHRRRVSLPKVMP
jgi:hypothetical protein